MPLKLIRRGPALYIIGTVKPAGEKEGRRIRQRAGSDNEKLAREELVRVEARILRDFHHGKHPSTHSFAEAVESYLQHQNRSGGTKGYCRRLLLYFGEAPLGSIDQDAWDKARTKVLRPNASAGSVRRALAALTAILEHAGRRNWMQVPKFDRPAQPRGRLQFFLPYQAEAMILEGGHLAPLFRFLFCTGCRVGETLGLEWQDVDLAARRIILWEGETKSGNRRIVDLVPAAVATLAALPGREGRVFTDRRGSSYRTTGGYGGQIIKAWRSALRRADLPMSLTPHMTRHSWASWRYALDQDLLRLKRDGGWSSVELVERYAHIMPAGHEDAIRRVWGLGTMQVVENRA